MPYYAPNNSIGNLVSCMLNLIPEKIINIGAGASRIWKNSGYFFEILLLQHVYLSNN